jgi:hypothetical protein
MMTMSNDKLISNLKELKTIAEECLTLLAAETDRRPVPRHARTSEEHEELDFGKPIRPFMKTHSKNLKWVKKVCTARGLAGKGRREKADCAIGSREPVEPDEGDIRKGFQSFLHGGRQG